MDNITNILAWRGANSEPERVPLADVRESLAIAEESTPVLLTEAPTEYVAATKGSGEIAGAVNGTLALEAVTAGDVDLTVTLVKPSTSNAALGIVETATALTINLATGAGDAATATLTQGIVVTWATAGPAPNNVKSVDTLLWSADLDFTNIPLILNSQPLEATTIGDVVSVTLAATAGTEATVTLTESSTSAGEVEISTKTGYHGEWASDIAFKIVVPDSPSSFAITNAVVGGKLVVTISLEVDSDSDVVPISDDNLATALNTAFGSIVAKTGVWNLDDLIVAASNTAGNFDTPLAQIAMSGGVDPIPDDTANTSVAVAGKIDALTEVSAVAPGGTPPPVTTIESKTFADGGANASVTTTIAALKTYLNAHSTLVVGGAAANDTDLCAAGTVTWTPGDDAISGTPATAGQFATDETDVWMAMKDSDGTATPSVWAKLT